MGAKAKNTRGKKSAPAKSRKRAAAKPAKKPTKVAKQAKKGTAKPAKKPAAKKARAPRAKPAAAIPEPALVQSAVDDDVGADTDVTADVEKKPGALARFGRGVGSLLAKVTGRGKKPAADGDPNDRTVELDSEDIVAVWPQGAKPPPPPGDD